MSKHKYYACLWPPFTIEVEETSISSALYHFIIDKINDQFESYKSLEAYIVFNFKTCGINRNTRKVIQISMLIKNINNHVVVVSRNTRLD